MSTAIQALSVLLPVLYLAAAVLCGMTLGGPRAPKVGGARRVAFAAAVLAHAALFAVRWRMTGTLPVDELWSSLSATAFGIALVWAWIARSARVHASGAVALASAFLLQLAASAFGDLAPGPAAAVEAGYAPHKLVHVLTAIGATATLALSGIHGVLYLFVYRGMRQHSLGALETRMPPLDELARLTRRAALAGFLLLAAGVNVGIWLAHGAHVPGFRYGDSWVLVVLALWLHFGVVAFSRRIPGFTARRASIAAAAGLAVLLASFAASLLPQFSFHWGS